MIHSLILLLGVSAAFATDAPAAKPDAAPAAADAAPLPAQAAAPARSAEELDKASEARIKEFEECVDTLAYFRADLKKKTAELDKEFNGKVPSSFSTLMNLKTNRIAKQNTACAKMTDFQIDASMASLKTMDSDSAAYAARRKKLGELRERINKAHNVFISN